MVCPGSRKEAGKAGKGETEERVVVSIALLPDDA